MMLPSGSAPTVSLLSEGSITVLNITTVMLPSDSVHVGNEHAIFGYYVSLGVLASVSVKTTNEG